MTLSYTQHTQRVAGKVALVTGAAQGLGAAICHCLAQHGAQVIATDINLQGAQEQIKDYPNAVAMPLDVTNEKQWQQTIGKIEKDVGQLHILVNNAGIASLGNVEEVSLEEWRKVHAVNLDGTFFGCKYALSLIKKTIQNDSTLGGSIINISSIAGIIANHNIAAYNSSKSAVKHLSKSVALHGAKTGLGIRCNSVHPVFIDTPIIDPLVKHLGDEGKTKLGKSIPLGKIGQVEDVAFAVLYLASDESKMVTGTELLIDGGISAM